jgi:hypothetical protein
MVMTVTCGRIVSAAVVAMLVPTIVPAIVSMFVAVIVRTHRTVIVRAILRTGDGGRQSGHGEGREGK